MRRLYDILRSRRLAVWLIVGTCAFAAAATLVPLGDPREPRIVSWTAANPDLAPIVGSLGLHQPFTTPVFVVVAVLLTLSTAACSWERTRSALAFWRATRPKAWRGDDHGKPTFAVAAANASDSDANTRRALKTLGMSAVHDPGPNTAVVAASYRTAIFGSPVFHWALVALFVSAGLGQLTRAEGELIVVDGASVTDARESYPAALATGPMFGERFTAAEIAVEAIESDLVVEGVARGDSPRVRVTRDGAVLAQGPVYPNNPLHFGGVAIHRGDLGPALRITFDFPDGQRLADLPVPLPNTDHSGRAMGHAELADQGTGDRVFLTFTQATGGRVAVSTGESETQTAPIAAGEKVTLSDGLVVTVEKLTVFSRLVVVNDHTVPFIYISFVLACMAGVVALMIPPRAVVAVYREQYRDTAVWILRKRIDPAFPARVRRAFGVTDPPPTEEPA